MFIELTDHLRCPAEHPEQYLVLLPETMQGRRVVSGELGCPVCGRLVRIVAGTADFGGGAASQSRTGLSAEAIAAFLGLSGPGGYVALVGAVASLAGELATLLPEIGLALVNPPAETPASSAAGVLRASRLPLKSGSMRGLVLGSDFAQDPNWVRDAVRAVLPGLRVVAEAGDLPDEGVELLARSEGVWVGRRLPISESHTKSRRSSPPSGS